MAEDSFLINLAIFAGGQVAVWGYLRTGLIVRGLTLLLASWVLADVALISRFAYDALGAYRVALALMQVLCLAELSLFVFGRLRRRSATSRAGRDRQMWEALLCYLRDELDGAVRLYRGVLRRDPWDLDAKLGLATALARKREVRRARALFRAARRLDRGARYTDVIREELRRLRG